MTKPEHIVESLLDDEVDPKDFVNAVKAEDDASRAALVATGVVNDRTVGVGSTIWHLKHRNADGTASRARVTSIKTWKTRPGVFEIGWKHGMYAYGKINQSNAGEWTVKEPAPIKPEKRKRA